MKIFRFILLPVCILNFVALGQEKTNKPDTLKYEMEQITVSATRYPEKVLEVPYAVSVLTGDQFEDLRGYGLDEILSSVPGVLAQSRYGNHDVRLVIRGYGARGSGDRSNSGTSRGIRVMVDGIPETEPDGRTSFDNVDITSAETIEVIRSNASATWGNAAGGVVNISSVPYFFNPFADLQGMNGSYGFQKYTLKSGALIGSGKIYGSVSTSSLDGWREHSDSRRTLLNIGMLSDLTPSTQMGVFAAGSVNKFNIPGPLTLNQFNDDPSKANSVYLDRKERRLNRMFRIGVSLDHAINEMHSISGMLFANPKFLQRSERNTFRDFTRYHIGGNIVYHNKFDITDNIRNIFVAGADEAYQDGAVLFYSLSPERNRGDELVDNKREGANSFGTFAQNEIIINDKISLILGGRYDNITYYSENFLDPELGLQEKTFEKVTPKSGMTYRLTPFHSIYANVGGGVEVPAGNETSPAGTFGADSVYLLNPLLEPIVSTTFELGTKHLILFEANSFIRSMSYDAALYHISVSNDIVPYSGGRFYFTAGKTRRSGIEIGTDINFVKGFSLKGAFTFSLNKYVEYLVDSVHYNNPGSFADYEGNKSAGIPDLFYNAGITWKPSFLYGMYLSFDVNGIGKYFADDANTIEVPAFYILNASVGTRKINLTDGIEVKGFVSVNNIGDKKYASSAFINPDRLNGEYVYLEPGLPRNFTAAISLIF
jgi:iron complex outermembrane recepter protein